MNNTTNPTATVHDCIVTAQAPAPSPSTHIIITYEDLSSPDKSVAKTMTVPARFAHRFAVGSVFQQTRGNPS